MGWEHTIAQAIKDSGDNARQTAVEDASAYIGKIEQLSPLIISLMEGEAMYEGEEEITQSRTFYEYGADKKKVGTEVIVLPVNGIDTIAIIDVVKGG